MNKLFLLVAILLLQINVNAQIPTNYYDSANGMTGYALKTQLSNIITNGHINRGYDNLYNGYETTDSDNYYENDGTVLDMYSENPNDSDPYNYTHGNNKCGNYSNEGDCYNREHLMPQSWFGSSSPMVSDIHHVVPSDGKVNGQRGHYPLADVSSASWTSQNGSKRGSCANTGYGGTVFEPIDEFKGDIARIYFYMATRYEDEIGSWENANSDGSDPVLDGSSDQVFEDWYLTVLLQWNAQDPVSQRELDRNQAAYNYQGNANPYIDHPEYVQLIWNQTPDTENPTVPTNLTSSNLSYDSVDLSWTAATDNIGVTSYKIYQDSVLIGTSATTNFSVTGLSATTTYNFYVVAYDAYNNFSPNSTIETITTLDLPTYLINEDFNDCNTISTNFTTYSEQSTNNWICSDIYGESNTGCMQMNGYQDDVLSKDWLITSNQIHFEQFDNEKLSVYLKYKYGDMSLDLVYSTDYDGTSNPSTFTWTAMPNITIDTCTGAEGTQEIINADISLLNQAAYVAFKYYSSSAPTRWNVDNFIIIGDVTSGINDNSLNNIISIYPNPTHAYFKIESNNKISQVTIYNIFGQQVIKTINAKEIDLQNINNGIYLCKIKDMYGNITIKKIIKK